MMPIIALILSVALSYYTNGLSGTDTQGSTAGISISTARRVYKLHKIEGINLGLKTQYLQKITILSHLFYAIMILAVRTVLKECL